MLDPDARAASLARRALSPHEAPDKGDLVESLALLTFPLTLAGVVILSRDATPLAERLLRRWRLGLTGAIGVLWLLTLGRLLAHADVAWVEALWNGVRGAAACCTGHLS